MKELIQEAPAERRTLVSRRTVLGGMMGAIVGAATFDKAWALGGASPEPVAAQRTAAAVSGTQAVTGTPQPRCEHAAAALPGGSVLVTGGWRQNGAGLDAPPMSGTQIFNPATGAWTNAAAMSRGRALHAAVTLADGRVLVMGGMNRIALADAEIYDPRTDQWSPAAPMGLARYGHVATLSGGLVVVTGGCHKSALSSIVIYDPASDCWQRSL